MSNMEDPDEDNPGASLEYQTQMSFALDVPSDNEVSTMVDQYLTKDMNMNMDDPDDWAAVVDNALFLITNPDHMSLPAQMTSPTTTEMGSYHMFTDHDLNSHHTLQQQQDQHQHHVLHQSGYGCFHHTPQYEDFQQYTEPTQEYSINLHQDHQFQSHRGMQSNGMGAYYDNHQTHIQHSSNNLFSNSQTSPVYYMQATNHDLSGVESHLDAAQTYQTYATLPVSSLPSFNTSTSAQLHAEHQSSVIRTLSSSSAGNSPSSQSPVSEEECHEPPPPKPTSRRRADAAGGAKKAKTVKPRRRKRDPNEPTKPVSAYALFFRDTQAAIKGSKPDASFGEVSKIVAHMWDNLDPDKKNMYKKRTEEAKKEYLQQLAVYRASLISSPSESSLYIQTNFLSRSPPMQMSSYASRHMFQNGNHLGHQHQHALKMHVQNVQPPTSNSRSPSNLTQDDCLRLSPVTHEGQVYARVVEPEMMQRNYQNHVTGLWESPIVGDEDGIVSHCKEMLYPWNMTGQQSGNQTSTKVII